jgi:MYXO-CTERM domain-containing protein
LSPLARDGATGFGMLALGLGALALGRRRRP